MAILATLADGELYGLELLRRLEARSNLVVAEGTVYPILGRLTKEGWLSARWVEAETGHPRKYYSLTAAGRRRALGKWPGALVRSLRNAKPFLPDVGLWVNSSGVQLGTPSGPPGREVLGPYFIPASIIIAFMTALLTTEALRRMMRRFGQAKKWVTVTVPGQ